MNSKTQAICEALEICADDLQVQAHAICQQSLPLRDVQRHRANAYEAAGVRLQGLIAWARRTDADRGELTNRLYELVDEFHRRADRLCAEPHARSSGFREAADRIWETLMTVLEAIDAADQNPGPCPVSQ